MEWNSLFIEPEGKINVKKIQCASYLRRCFKIDKKIKSAILYSSACGVYKGYLNGNPIDNQVLMPGFTYYNKRLQYQVNDVTKDIITGDNNLGFILGNGWYRGTLYFAPKKTRYVYGYKTKLLVILDITYSDGTKETITTDEKWKATQNGPIRKNDLMDGEVYDAQLEMDGWNTNNFDDSNWHGVYKSYYSGELVSSDGENIIENEKFKPIIISTPKGETILDFGQNIAGYVEFKIDGKKGQTIKLKHGEVLDENGNFTMKNFMTETMNNEKELLQQEVTYICKDGVQTYKPHFTFHGFRYVRVTGLEKVIPEDFTAIAVYSDLLQTGTFECSNNMINKLVNNARWSQKGNFLDIPTDCPTRERAGWTGDIAAYCEAGSYLMRTDKFLKKWLKDLTLQQNNGKIPSIIPYVGNSVEMTNGSAGWADVAIIAPYTIYKMFGDKVVLEEQYKTMTEMIDFIEKRAKKNHLFNILKKNPYKRYTVDTGFHFGEWLEPGDSEGSMLKSIIKPDSEVATAYYAYSLKLLGEIAKILNKVDDEKKYNGQYEKVKKAYQNCFIDGGIIDSKRQCKYVRPIALDLLSDSQKKKNAEKLNKKVIENNYRIGTGFLTTPLILSVLSDYGYLDTAYKMLENTEYPGWLYQIKNGATTIWENWNGIDEKKVPRSSMNHYVYGSVVGWLFSRAAGIKPLAPGFEKILIQPLPGGSLSYVNCTYESINGEIKSNWAIKENLFKLYIQTPADTIVIMPNQDRFTVKKGAYNFECSI